MRTFSCRVCGSEVFFTNTDCLRCGTSLAYSRSERDLVPLEQSVYVDADEQMWFACRQRILASCTWLATSPGGLCDSCRLTRTRPNDADVGGLAEFVAAESAKRYLIAELDAVSLPVIEEATDPGRGLAFDLLSSAHENVTIGHADGVITLDLAETRPEHREKVRVQLDEPYRTVLGHLRHEVGHYYQALLVDGTPLQARCRELFGDDTADYQAAIDKHYRDGPPDGWREQYISAYATMHPYEDFAESFAHFLHIRDTMDTAAGRGLIAQEPLQSRTFRQQVSEVWLPLSISLNQLNRSMGKDDLYPFVLTAPVLDKLEFVSQL